MRSSRIVRCPRTGRIYAINPRIRHLRGQHERIGPVEHDGWYSVRTAYEAWAWDFSRRGGGLTTMLGKFRIERITADFRGRTETMDRASGLDDWTFEVRGFTPLDWNELATCAANIVGFAWMGVREIWDAGDRIHSVTLQGENVEMEATLMDKDDETRHPLVVRAVLSEVGSDPAEGAR